MNVSIISKMYYPQIGGLEKVIKKIAEGVIERNDNCCVYTCDGKSGCEINTINGVKIVRTKAPIINLGLSFRFLLTLHKHKRSIKNSIVHIHALQDPLSFEASLFCKINNIPYIVTTHYHGKGHNNFYNLLLIPYKKLASIILRWSTLITCVSLYEKDKIMNDLSFNNDKILLIPNGVDRLEMKKEIKRDEIIRLLFIGRLVQYKGLKYIFYALKELDNNSIDYVITIIGSGEDENELRSEEKKLKLKGKVKWLKHLSDDEIHQEMRDADILILLSEFEAYGLVVAEALINDVPCIVSNSSALSYFTQIEGCSGMNFPIDRYELMNEILYYYNNPFVGNTNGIIFSWDDIIQRYYDVYNNI